MLSARDENIHYFNINEILAREFWKTHNLYEDINNEFAGKKYKIGIIGFDSLGKSIFKQAYLNNIYSLNQCIEYHIWGADAYQITFLESLNLVNSDHIIVHREEWLEAVNTITDMNRVIISQENDINAIQVLIGANPLLYIFAFSKSGENFSKMFESNHICSFGNVSSILNEKTIKSEQTYLMAKLFNYDYYIRANKTEMSSDYEKEMNEQWQKLSGFKRNSSIARADFYWIEKRKKNEGTSEEDIWEMEHIRWCRFHYINHWVYGPQKDEERKTHPLLVDFSDLPYSEKEKDGIHNGKIMKMIEQFL